MPVPLSYSETRLNYNLGWLTVYPRPNETRTLHDPYNILSTIIQLFLDLSLSLDSVLSGSNYKLSNVLIDNCSVCYWHFNWATLSCNLHDAYCWLLLWAYNFVCVSAAYNECRESSSSDRGTLQVHACPRFNVSHKAAKAPGTFSIRASEHTMIRRPI